MGRAAWLSLMVLWGCNGAGGAGSPSEPSPPTSTASGENGEPARPSGDAQPRLPQGKVVLEAPPRAPVELTVEVADDPESQRRGLMFREKLGDDEGMLFVFPYEKQQSFWMRNTLIPLDMFFIDAELNVVGVVENAEPLTDSPRRVEGKSQYVLEVNAGFAKQHGFGPGTRVRYTPPSAAASEQEK